MAMKWTVFLFAALSVVFLLILRGAPPAPVICGAGLAGLFHLGRRIRGQ